MLGLLILALIIAGPRSKWVAKCLPNKANKALFALILGSLGLMYTVAGLGQLFKGGDLGEAIFTVCVGFGIDWTLLRFIKHWRKPIEYEQIDWNDGEDLTKSPRWKGENWRSS